MITPLQLLFYVFATLLVCSAVVVVWSRKAIHSVLFLILAFFNAAGLFLLAGAEFLAMVLVVVYVGAVAVLFLFVVMLLDFRSSQEESHFKSYTLPALVVALLLGGELGFVTYHWRHLSSTADFIANATPHHIGNTNALGEILYTHYFLAFQIAGLILLVAMIAAITLIVGFNGKPPFKKQDIRKQALRSPTNSLVMTNPDVGQGVVPGKIELAKEPPHHG